MKKLIISILAIVLLQVSNTQANSIYLAESPVDLAASNTNSTTNINSINTYCNFASTTNNLLFSFEKRKVFVKAKDGDNTTTATAIINFISSSGVVIHGPFVLVEEEVLEVELEQADLEIDIVESTKGVIIEYWYDNQ